MWEAVTYSQRLSITLRCLATGNNFEDLKFIRVTSQSTGIIVQETCLLLGRQTVTEWILRSTVHRLFNILRNIMSQSSFIRVIQYIAQPFNITTRPSILCNNSYRTIFLTVYGYLFTIKFTFFYVVNKSKFPIPVNNINPLKTKHVLFYIRTQSVPRSKHIPLQL
jgi:hypothetical protein